MHINSEIMNKNILLSLLIIATIIVVSCKKEDEVVIPPFDHEAQISIDQDSIDNYLDNHYFNTDDNRIWAIGSPGGALVQLPLNEDSNLKTIEGIEANGTVGTYKMYYYEIAEGIDNGNEGFSSPSPVDSVFVKYTGMLLDSTVFDSREDYPVWFMLPNTIQGWAKGLPKFKRGTFEADDDVGFIFHDSGKGYLIMPSGLGYQNGGTGLIPANSPLIFRIELNDVKLIDTDLDMVPTKFEINYDLAGNITTYSTDGDTRDDFQDVDDDNDFTLTKDEVLDEYVYILNNEGKLDTIYDARGNIDFPYGVDDETEQMIIVRRDGADGNPDYKDSSKHLEPTE